MENTTTDFRKWLAYHNDLTNEDTRSLFESLKTMQTNGKIQLQKLTENGESCYLIGCVGSPNLKLTEAQRVQLLNYLSDHYIKPEASPRISETTNATIHESPSSRVSSRESQNESWINTTASILVSANTFIQAIKFSIVGILIFQLIVIPQFVLDIEFPKIVTIVFAFLVLTTLSHVSVRLYRKRATSDDKVRYSFAWRLILPFITLLYVEFNAEVTLLELIKGTSVQPLTTLLLFIVYLLFGVFMGFFFSILAYFTNGGTK